jgi:23S rRNA (uracil1939-C5)-methyltransferase
MDLRKGQIVEIDIDTLAFGGAGMGKHNGMSVFVEKTMPGDKAKVAFTKIKKNFAHADLVEITKESPDRISPKCPYSGTCGGCQLQFMPYQKQLEFKKQQVIDTFERIGKIYSPPVKDVIGCKDDFYYRNKMEFSFGYDAGMNFALGLHLPHRRYDILDLSECHLQSPFTSNLLNAVKNFCLKTKWKPFKFSNGEGFLRSLFVREGKNTGEIMINLTTSDSLPKDFDEGIKKFIELLKNLEGIKITSVYWSKIVSKRGTPKEIHETLLFGKPTLKEKLNIDDQHFLTFEIAPQAFFQVNTFQAEILYREVLKIVQKKSPDVVFDLFCGTGSIGMFVSKHAKKIIGIELNEEAIKVAEKNAEENNIQNIEFFHGEVSKTLESKASKKTLNAKRVPNNDSAKASSINQNPDLIIVDPPRVGLGEKLVEQLLLFDAPSIIYVSCNPATLARDCEQFQAHGYSVKKVQPVDMFPHTFHIENVCLLEK